MGDIMLSNVIGTPFSENVLQQLYQRAARNSTTIRSNEEVLFLANKTAWVRMISSVDIDLDNNIVAGSNQTAADTDLGVYYQKLGINDTSNYPDGTSLAKRWILEAGTSIYHGNTNSATGATHMDIDLRSGLGQEGAYGLGGIEQQGYRPMPGLTSVTIDTAGRLGSLRVANINFKVWNMNQLNVIEALYFRLGYSMLLEWGHTQYYTNKSEFVAGDIYGIDDPFADKLRKEDVQQKIAYKVRNSDGNYDGMLGIVSNFTWSFNQEGGYDCTVKLIGLGAIMDTMRINQAYTLPTGLIKGYYNALKKIEQLEAERRQREYDAAHPPITTATTSGNTTLPIHIPTTVQDFYDQAVNRDGYSKDFTSFRRETSYYGLSFATSNLSTVQDYYYKGLTPEAQAKFGLLLQQPLGKLVRLSDTSTYNLAFNEIDVLADQAVAATFVDPADLQHFQAYPIPSTTVKMYMAGLEIAQQGAVAKITAQASVAGGGTSIFGWVIQQAVNTVTNIFSSAIPVSVNSTPSYNTVNDTVITIPFTRSVQRAVADGALKTPFDTDTKDFTVELSVHLDKSIDEYAITIGDISKALNTWIEAQKASPPTNPLKVESIVQSGYPDDIKKYITVTGTTIIQIPANTAAYLYTNTSAPPYTVVIPAKAGTNPAPINLTLKVKTNDTRLITLAGSVIATPPVTNTPAAGANTTAGATNTATSDQTNEAFESALTAMLAYVKVSTQAAGAGINMLKKPYDLVKATKTFYGEGVLNGVDFTAPAKPFVPSIQTQSFDLTMYAQKGFNASLMANENLYGSIPPVDFAEMSKSYFVMYGQGGKTSNDIASARVYITLGYLLAFLNNMCLIYDNTKDKSTTIASNPGSPGAKRPYVYIDFNPETNFCLTSPQQLSVDPLTCLIPFAGDDNDYEAIYQPEMFKALGADKFTSKENYVSTRLPDFRTASDKQGRYQGKIMNILLDVDYLIQTAHNFSTSDPEHSVNLKRYLEAIMLDVNKSLGNFNVFRVAYLDESNTIQIRDDQWTPNPSANPILDREYYKKNFYHFQTVQGIYGGADISKMRYGQLPIFGAQSMVRSFQFKTNLSTKLSSMIAISAQAETGSINAKDPSPLSHLNKGYVDRYKPRIQNPTPAAVVKTAKNPPENNDEAAAKAFNAHIKSVYGNLRLNADLIETAKNYYIERSAIAKTSDPITSAAPFIPADLEITIDGIGGIIMGQAFTIPEDRMPATLRGDGDVTKVGFIVAGLTHTLDNNEWLTKIRGQMPKYRMYPVHLQAAVEQVEQHQTAHPLTRLQKTKLA
jgi:hypothetical protein